MEPRVLKYGPFNVVGIQKKTNLTNNTIPKMWEEFLPRMNKVSKKSPQGICYGICQFIRPEELTNETMFDELVCVQVSEFKDIPQGMIGKEIKQMDYAVFTHLGSTYDYIYKSWLPKSGYEVAEADDFELYDDRFDVENPENSEMDIYIPIRI